MNPFDDIIATMGVESSLYVRMQFRAPWGITFDTGYQARILMLTRGECWLVADGMEPIRMRVGQGLIIKAGTEFSMQDSVGGLLLPCSQIFSDIDGRLVRHGGSGDMVEMISARLSFDPAAAEPLMALLPSLLHVTLGETDATLLQATLHLIGMETFEDGLGANLIISRLTDVLFIQTIRSWFASEDQQMSGWLAGLKNRRLAAAITAMHKDIADPWTVDSLAREARMSRSSFAASFKSILGDTPMGYLANWRMYRAKALLRQGLGVAEVATQVGYESDTELSRAFKRSEGLSPGAWRNGMRGGPPAVLPADQRHVQPV